GRVRDTAEVSQETARGRARRQGGRNRGLGTAGAHGDIRPARDGGAHPADPGHVSESRRRQAKAASHEDSRGDEDAHRRGGGSPRQRGGPACQGTCECRRERHRVSGRDRQDHEPRGDRRDRKSTRLNSSHVSISYAVFCLKKKKNNKKKEKSKEYINK